MDWQSSSDSASVHALIVRQQFHRYQHLLLCFTFSRPSRRTRERPDFCRGKHDRHSAQMSRDWLSHSGSQVPDRGVGIAGWILFGWCFLLASECQPIGVQDPKRIPDSSMNASSYTTITKNTRIMAGWMRHEEMVPGVLRRRTTTGTSICRSTWEHSALSVQ